MNEMGGAHGTDGEEEKWLKGFGAEMWGEKSTSKT